MKYKLVFNPFERYQERLLISVGIIALLVGSALAYLFNARFDGVLDLHFVPQIKVWQALVDNLINVACLGLCLGVLGFYINKKTRVIDILAVCLLARIPYYFLTLFNVNHVMLDVSEEIIKDPMAITGGNIPMSSLLLLLVFSGFSLLAVIWQLTLLYNGTKVASNAKGIKFTLLFIVAIIVAEIISKLLINY